MKENERFWIYGVFPENNMMPGVKQIDGGEFTIRHPAAGYEETFYYYTKGKRGKDFQCITILPSHGLSVCRTDSVKAAKEWCLEHMDQIAEKCETPEMIRVERRFAELVRQARERQECA